MLLLIAVEDVTELVLELDLGSGGGSGAGKLIGEGRYG